MSTPVPGGRRRTALIGGLLSLALAAFFTFMTPLHVLWLKRAPDGRVSGHAVRFLLVAVPIRSYNLAGLDKVEAWADASSRSASRRTSLAFWGGEGFRAEIPVDPANADEVKDRITVFLKGTGTASLWQILVPTWALGVVIPLIIASLGMRLTCQILTGGHGLARGHAPADRPPGADGSGAG